LTGRVAVVAGADLAAGRATAAFLARAGAAVVLAGRDGDALEGLARDLRALGATAQAAPLDPDDRARGAEVIAQAADRLGEPDLLVLFGDAQALLAAAAPRLAARGRGQIVLVAPPDPEADLPAGAERAALLATAARGLAGQGRGHGVVVTLLRPGPLAEDLGLPSSPARLRPEDLAQAVLSLAAFAPGVRPAELVLVPLAAPAADAAGSRSGSFTA
jgi:short-subunit dehydrogenase